MKRLAVVLAATLVATIALRPPPVAAQGDAAVTGVGQGVFPIGAQFNGITLDGLQFENGVVFGEDGSATGEFHTVLLGPSQDITVEGQVSSGYVDTDGSATFGGVGTVDLGNGQTLSEVPFTVTITAQGLELTIGHTTLPRAAFMAGSITIE